MGFIHPGSGLQGFAQGLEEGDTHAQQHLQNTANRQRTLLENQRNAGTLAADQFATGRTAIQHNKQFGLKPGDPDYQTPPNQLQQNPDGTYQIPDPFRTRMDQFFSKVRGMFGGSSAAPPQVSHSAGPADQATVPGKSDVAASAPAPGTSNPAAGGTPGATGGAPTADTEAWRASHWDPNGPNRAEGGFIGGALGKPRGVTPPTGIKPRRPRNTEASPSAQGVPSFDDGGATDQVVVTPPATQATTPPGTKQAMVNGKQMTVSADPEVEARAQKAMAYLDDQAKAQSTRRAAGRGVPARNYATTAQNTPAYAGGGSVQPDYTSLSTGGAASPRSPQQPDVTALRKPDPSLNPHPNETPVGSGVPGRQYTLGLDTKGPPPGKPLPPSQGSAAYPDMGGSNDTNSQQVVSDLNNPNMRGPNMPGAAPAPAAQGDGLAPINPTAQRLPAPQGVPPTGIPARGTPKKGGKAAAPSDADAGPTPGSGKPQGKIDFDIGQLHPSDVPSVTADEWEHLKYAGAAQATMRGMDPVHALVSADESISNYQHDQFIQYFRQGIALEAAGNKIGAMSALKAAYQYMPNGKDMKFGTDAQGQIVGYGVDDRSGQLTGSPILLNQKNLNDLLDRFVNVNAFREQSRDYGQMQIARNTFSQVTVPEARARVGLYGAHANYFNEMPQARLAALMMRAGGQDKFVQLQQVALNEANHDMQLMQLPPGSADYVVGTATQIMALRGDRNITSAYAVAKQLVQMDPAARAQAEQKMGLVSPQSMAESQGNAYGNTMMASQP